MRLIRISPLLAASLMVIAVSAREEAAQPPSVVVILVDDQGWGDLRVPVSVSLRTPNINSLTPRRSDVRAVLRLSGLLIREFRRHGHSITIHACCHTKLRNNHN